MRYASYISKDGTATWGVEDGDALYDLGPSGLDIAGSLLEAIQQGITAGPAPEHAGAPATPVAEAEFLPVLDRPGKVICIGVNYRSHQDEIGRPGPTHPTVFIRFADTLAAADAELPVPPESEMYDYEGELALVIGKHADHLAKEDAFSVIDGYAAFNDLSARDWQRHTGQWTPGKNFPASGAFGPFYVPAADVDDVEALSLETRVNGEVRQKALLADLIFDIPAIIEYVTKFTPLSPGDVIVTGTPGGVGLFMEPQTFLRPGDLVEVDITGMGLLANRLV